MFASLKKNGLSDTVHQLKSQLSESISRLSRASNSKSSQVKKTQPTGAVSKFELQEEVINPKKYTVLDILIELITTKEQQACTISQHQFNIKKYICLEETCQKKLGCSYCFLQNHKMHAKIETGLCIKDLTELKVKAYQSRRKMKTDLLKKKLQMKERIELDINKIRQQFNTSLDYLNSKILDSLEKQVDQKLASIENYLQNNKESKKQLEENKTKKKNNKRQNISKEDDFQQILQAFNNHSSNNLLLSSNVQKTSNVSKPKYKKQKLCIYDISKQDEAEILKKLAKFNLREVQQYLRHESLIIQEFGEYLNIFSDFYNQMSASLSEFFAAFKRALPICPSIQNRLNQPEILRNVF